MKHFLDLASGIYYTLPVSLSFFFADSSSQLWRIQGIVLGPLRYHHSLSLSSPQFHGLKCHLNTGLAFLSLAQTSPPELHTCISNCPLGISTCMFKSELLISPHKPSLIPQSCPSLLKAVWFFQLLRLKVENFGVILAVLSFSYNTIQSLSKSCWLYFPNTVYAESCHILPSPLPPLWSRPPYTCLNFCTHLLTGLPTFRLVPLRLLWTSSRVSLLKTEVDFVILGPQFCSHFPFYL